MFEKYCFFCYSALILIFFCIFARKIRQKMRIKMRNRPIFMAFTLVAAMVFSPMSADVQQKRKKTQKVVLTEEEKEHIARMAEMEIATQKVVFVDSVVVDKNEMLAALSLPPEAGSLATAKQVVGDKFNGVAFVTELGDRCIFSAKDANGAMRLWHSDKLDGVWAEPQPLAFGGDTELGNMDFPFMMADGATLYFAAEGGDGIGGYDIYVTRFNADDNSFYKPENIGMPFCSEANDYFYVVDEYDNIGWFATDRRQPEGKVCIYTFVPTETRETYSIDMDEEKLRCLSQLHSIAATWGNGSERKAALKRIADMAARKARVGDSKETEMSFVINNNTVYTSPRQFRAEGNVGRYGELLTARQEFEHWRLALEKLRAYYPKANDEERAALRQEILSAEQRAETTELKIKQLEKEIRNAENEEILR